MKTGLADLAEKINSGLQRLYGYQHIDGGWGWWHDDDSHAYQTAWVVYGLAMTMEAGFEVDPEVIRRGADWLVDNLEEMDIRALQDTIMSVIEQAERINLILDFGNVQFLSSAVLGLLIRISKRVYEVEGRLKLCNINPKIYEMQSNR